MPQGIDDGRLDELYERLEELDVATVEKRAAEILHGLGFTPQVCVCVCVRACSAATCVRGA
eukprot:COSAG05_NODE_2920_length_2509_cov_85.126141_4_plen_61_part_00